MTELDRFSFRQFLDSLASNPPIHWAMVAVSTTLGVAFLVRGFHAVTNRNVTAQTGAVAQGAFAELLGIVYLLAGISLLIGGYWLYTH